MDEPRAPRAMRIAAIAAVVVLAFAGAGNHGLWIYDEPREAELARALWRSGQWTYTVLNEQPFLEKPPLFSLTVALGFAVAGAPSVLAARIVAALWSLATLATVAWFARRIANGRVALLAALVLATTNRFEACQHTILLDNALVTFTTAALSFGWVAATERRRGLAILAGGALAGAFLVKGVVGVGIVGLVLGLDLAWRRDGAGARTLLHPLALLAAIVPPALYAALLWQRGGADLCHELFWNNQVGRFLHGYGSKHSHWHVYFSTWWEMAAPWTPVAALAILRPPTARSGVAARPFLLLWALAPLVALSFSQARSRFYAVPVTPANALLVALLWEEVALGPRARAAVSWLLLAATGVLLGLAGAIGWLRGGDLATLLAALAALGALALRRKDSRESLALGVGLAVLAGWLIWASDLVADLRDPHQSFRELAAEVAPHVGERRLVLFHANDSYSGTFPFYADRSVLGFDEMQDPHGERLVAAVTSRDAVLAPSGALDLVPEEKRREFVPEGVYGSPKGEKLQFVLYHRRAGAP